MARFRLSLLAVSLALLWTCSSPMARPSLSRVELRWTGAENSASTLGPEISLSIVAFEVSGVGPGEEGFSLYTEGSGCTVEDLIPGTWSFSVSGKNAAGVTLIAGSESVEIPTEDQSITIYLAALRGVGTLHVEIIWDEATVATPSFELTLEYPDGTPHAPNAVASTGSVVLDVALEAGNYILSFSLLDDLEVVAGFAESVCILSGRQTLGSIELQIPIYPVAGQLAWVVPRIEAIPISISGPSLPAFVGESLAMSAAMEDSGTQGSFRWYVDGQPGGVGPTISLAFPTNGVHRVDAVATDLLGSVAGSASRTIEVSHPVFYGDLVYVDSYFDGVGDLDGLSGVRDIVLAPDGQRLLTAGTGEDEIGVFAIAPSSGELSFVSACSSTSAVPLGAVRSLAISQDGLSVFAACHDGDCVSWLSLDPESGRLSGISSVSAIDGAADIIVSPDDRFLYVAADTESRVVVLGIDVVAGVLTPTQTLSQDSLPSIPFGSPHQIAMSGDGSILAVSCWDSDSVLLFRRDAESGALSCVDYLEDGHNGADRLNGPSGMALSVDGSELAVAAYYDHSVSLFADSSGLDSWSLVATYSDGEDGVLGMRYPRAVAVDPVTRSVYVAAGGSDAIVVFSRTPAEMELSYAATATNGDDRIEGLDGVRSLATSWDGSLLFTAASNDGAVALFRRYEE